MNTKTIKNLSFMATVSVLLISIGNTPVIFAGCGVGSITPCPGQITIIEYCDVQISSEDMTFDTGVDGSGVLPGETASAYFTLVNNANADAVLAITGDHWYTTEATPQILINQANTSFDYEGAGSVAFDGTAQTLGQLNSGNTATVGLQTYVQLALPTYLGTGTLDILVSQTDCTTP